MIFKKLDEMARLPEPLDEDAFAFHLYPLHAMEVKHTTKPVQIPIGIGLDEPEAELFVVLPAQGDWAKGFVISPALYEPGEEIVLEARNVSGRTMRLNQNRPIAQIVPVNLVFERESEQPDDVRESE